MELGGEREFLHRCDPAKRHIRAFVVIRPEPLGCHFLHLLDRIEQRRRQPGIAHGAAIAFDIGVLLRFARLDVVDANAVLCRPVE